jgi:hypothetical protein
VAWAARDQVIAELGRAVEELLAEIADLRRRLDRNGPQLLHAAFVG